LVDPKSSLSIKVAALVILNGQNFFNDKLISGIPWSKLSEEQKAAALTAYYTVGEHAVSLDMKDNKFFPFGAGPSGGRVGGWVTYGQNFEILQSILSNRKTPAISVAPKPMRKRAAKRRANAFPQTEIDDFHAALMTAARTFAALGINRDTKEVIHTLMASADTGPSHGIVDALADNRKAGKWIAALSGGGATVPSILAARRQTGGGGTATRHLAPFRMPPILGTRPQTTLPSFAPTRKSVESYGVSRGGNAESGENRIVSKDSVSRSADSLTNHPQMDQWQFREMLSRELDDQARLPPSGGTGFDPRLSPAWPGMKLPN
jgi:hypothetical protein